MVVFYLRNSRLPDSKVVPVTVSLTNEQVLEFNFPTTGSGFPNLLDQEGDTIWLLVVAPPRQELDKDTNQPIPPQIINLVSQDTVHLELEAALGRIGSRVAWGTLLPDTQPPKLIELTPPIDQTQNVKITSNIVARIQDPLPAAGIDLSTINVKLNDFYLVSSGVVQPGHDVSFTGNIFDLTIIFEPKRFYC